MSSIAVNSCLFLMSLLAFIGHIVFADQLQCTEGCLDTQVCRTGSCVPCKDICDPSVETYSISDCSDLCPDYVLVKTSKAPIISTNDKLDVREDNEVLGTRVVATMLQEKDNTSADFNVQEEKAESSGTMMSLGDMAAICGVIAFIIFCIGLRILTKEYPCPWFVTPKNTRPIKLEENTDEMAELNV